MTVLENMGQNAKKAARFLNTATDEQKNKALEAIASGLINDCGDIISANKKDIENGEKAGLSKSLLDRLMLNEERVKSMAQGVIDVAALACPVGRVLSEFDRPNGLHIKKISVPMGVIGIIYEARPNVTSDAASLCLKSGNAVILRGGKEAIHSNAAISNSMRKSLACAGFPADCVALVADTSRESSNEMMRLNKYIDLLIPRGGAGLISAVVENSTVPVIETGTGNCHTYIDASADLKMAADIAFNAKTSRPSVCNACETLLVHKDIANKVLPAIKALTDTKNVELRGCNKTREILGNDVVTATESDYETEFLDYILAVRVVKSLDEAIEHIYKYSSGHSECIVTQDEQNAKRFTSEIDAAAVYVNASTRFTDGGEFGFGAEIGISTQKLHARGPMGINELTSYKYIIFGNGQIR